MHWPRACLRRADEGGHFASRILVLYCPSPPRRALIHYDVPLSLIYSIFHTWIVLITLRHK